MTTFQELYLILGENGKTAASQFKSTFHQATDSSLSGPNWELNLFCSDLIQRNPKISLLAAKLMLQMLNSCQRDNTHKSTLLCLLLLDFMMSNCPFEFQIAVAKLGFAEWMKKFINRVRFKARSQLKKVDLRIEMKMLQLIKEFAKNYQIYGENSVFSVFQVVYDDLKKSGANFPEVESGSESHFMDLEGAQSESQWSWKRIFGCSKDKACNVKSELNDKFVHDVLGRELPLTVKPKATYDKISPMLILNFSETSDLFEDIMGCLRETISSSDAQASSIQRYIELSRSIKRWSLDPVYEEVKRRIPESGKVARSELKYMCKHIDKLSKTMELLIEEAKALVMYSSPVRKSTSKVDPKKACRKLPLGEPSHDKPETLDMTIEPRNLRWDIRFNEKVTKRKILHLQNKGGCNLAFKILTTTPDVHFVSPRQGYMGKGEDLRVKIYLDHPSGFARKPCRQQIRIQFAFLHPDDFFQVPVADFWASERETKRITIKCRWSKRSASTSTGEMGEDRVDNK